MKNANVLWLLFAVGVPASSVVLFTADALLRALNLPGLTWVLVVLGAINIVYVSVIGFLARPSVIDHKRLEKQLVALLNVIGVPDGADVRCAIWTPKGKQQLRQITRYMPGKTPPGLAQIAISQGIVGSAYRSKEAKSYIVSPDLTVDEYRLELINDWGFTEEEAARINKEKRVFLALPILDLEDKVKGILYIDSQDAEAFESIDLENVLSIAQNAVTLLEPLL